MGQIIPSPGRFVPSSAEARRVRPPRLTLGTCHHPFPQAAPGAAARVSALLRRLIGHRRFEAMLAALGGMRQGKRHSFPDRAGLELFMGDTKVDSAKAHEALGFSARRSFLGTVEQIVSDMDNS